MSMTKMKFDLRIAFGAIMGLTLVLWLTGITSEKLFWLAAGIFLVYNIYSLGKKLRPVYSKR